MSISDDNFEVWDFELPRSEIRFIKQQVRQSREATYQASKRLQEPFTMRLAKLHPKTRALYRVWTFLGFFNLATLTVLPLVLLIFTRWYWAITLIVFNILVVQRIHNALNRELFARVTLIYLKMEGTELPAT